MENQVLAAVEAGGTSWVAALAYENDLSHTFSRIEVPTDINPQVTISAIRVWLRNAIQEWQIKAVGVASFGPIDPKLGSDTYGFITSTPKPGWANTDVIGMLGLMKRENNNDNEEEYDCKIDGEFSHLPFLFDTDVNAPALAEFIHSQNENVTSSAYVTVGTGVGAGAVINSKPVAGMLHPEAGHILVHRMEGDDYIGACPFHKNCLEGMVCSKALAERAGLWKVDNDPTSGYDQTKLADLTDDHPIWDTAAYYLAQLAMSFILMVSIERIIYGGGIFNRKILYKKIRVNLKEMLNGYIQNEALLTDEGLENFIVESVWGSQAGLIGAVFLASEALKKSQI
jgi:fructokinase